MTVVHISELVKRELHSIVQPELAALAHELLTLPRLEHRSWDYGEKDERLPCWLVLEHQKSNTGIGYCAHGFGPRYPWGLLFLSGEHMSMGMDSAWFASLEEALRNCAAWSGPNPPDYEVE